MRLSLLALFLVVLLPATMAQVCITPINGLSITENTELCPGTYQLTSPLKITNDDIFVRCQATTLEGTGLGAGIRADGVEGIRVEECTIKNFEVGIYFAEVDSGEIKENSITDNRIGVALYRSSTIDVEDNAIVNNSRSDEVIYSPVPLFDASAFIPEALPEEEPETAEEPEEPEPAVVEPIEEPEEPVALGTKKTPTEILSKVVQFNSPDLSPAEVAIKVEQIFLNYFDRTQSKLDIFRSYTYDAENNVTTVDLRIAPKEPLQNLSIYEDIPKCMADVVTAISFDLEPIVIEEDPLVAWQFNSLATERTISYRVNNDVNDDCRNLLTAFGIATQFVDDVVEVAEESSFARKLVLAVVSISIVIFFVRFLRLRGRRRVHIAMN